MRTIDGLQFDQRAAEDATGLDHGDRAAAFPGAAQNAPAPMKRKAPSRQAPMLNTSCLFRM
jgi:hypothetical protein